MEILKKKCNLCEKEIEIVLEEYNQELGGHPYSGGHYFGRMFEDTEKEHEYWECDDCYKSWEEGDSEE